MENNINGGVNNDSAAKLKSIIADGQVKAEELKGLTSAEKEALRKYLIGEGKDLPVDGEIIYLKDPVEQRQYASNGAILWDAISNAAKKVLAGIIALSPLGLISCQGDIEYEGGDVNVQTGTTANITFSNANLNAAIDTLTSAISTLTDMMSDSKTELGDIKKLLTDLNTYIALMHSTIEAADKKNQDLLAKILQKISDLITGNEANIKNNEEIIKFLKAIAESVDKMSADQTTFYSTLIEKYDSLEKTTKEGFAALIEKGQIFGTELSNALNLFMKNYDAMEKAQIDKFDEIINLLAKLPTQEQLNNVDALIAELINLVKDKTAIDAKYQAEIMAKLDKMSTEEANFHAALLDKLDTLTPAQQADLTEIYNAIKENTAVANKTYITSTLILDSIEYLKANGDKLNIKLDDAIKVLKDLATKEPSECKFNQQEFQAFIAATVNGLIDQFKTLHKEALDNDDANTKAILDKLNDILNKIPAGCKCDNSEILAKLEVIINNMQKPTIDDTTHEGIIGDLGDLFG